MGDLIPLLFLADIALLVAALYDCVTTDEASVRALPKTLWVLLILLFSPVGGIMWFVAGRALPEQSSAPSPRPRTATRATGGGFGVDRRTDAVDQPPRSLAPDDDPEFLARLTLQSRRDDEERLRKWEADLLRREERLRDTDEPPAP